LVIVVQDEGGDPLEPRGCAQRWRTSTGELWRFPPGHGAVVRRLLALGRAGIAGFAEGSEDATDPFALRLDVGTTLWTWMREHGPSVPWEEAVPVGIALAEALAEAERLDLFPGPLHPKGVSVRREGPGIALHADALVDAIVGHASSEQQTMSTRWLAPEQAAGAAWNNAANRYVLGLLLYCMLCGEHPFVGKGLRLGLTEQARRGAPPFAERVATTLPPGLQAFVLRMLDPRAPRRPHSAQAIADGLRAVAEEARPVAEARTCEPRAPAPIVEPTDSTASLELVAARGGAWSRALIVPLFAGAALFAAVRPAIEAPSPPTPVAVGETTPLAVERTQAEDCAACHPRQVAQWHGSVMAHSVGSPLFQALEILIEEQVGRRFDCPEGAGVLRPADGGGACRDPASGLPVTGSGGQGWCINCHAPRENLAAAVVPAWNGLSRDGATRRPLVDLLPQSSMEGIGCVFCHAVHGPVQPGNAARGRYEGNPSWFSTVTGQRFAMRPEDRLGRPGIANSGYSLDASTLRAEDGAAVTGGAHGRPSEETRAYLRSSEFCGACHDVRLFGTDAIGVQHGEHFKRLRNAYSEWSDWAQAERRAGREPASCQDCHMSAFPGVCVPDEVDAEGERLRKSFSREASSATALERACPDGHRFEARPPGTRPAGAVATPSNGTVGVSTHYFSGVDVPLASAFPEAQIDDPTLDVHGIPRGAKQRRDMLLGRTFRFEVETPQRVGTRVEIPVVIENVGAGHKVPAGFSQEREFWVHLLVTDAEGRTLYEVGRVDRDDEDLRDKIFLRVNVDDRITDAQGQPLGVFGADVIDGPDVPRWTRVADGRGGLTFRGDGLVNLQNGFLRCVRCIGRIDERGRCQPGPGQGSTRAARYADGAYDPDTGECRSNLFGEARFFEVYFPVGSLDATRGVVRGPDAIIDTRSASPGVPQRYVYDLPIGRARGPLRVQARLLFRAFPPFLIEAFVDYEARAAARGRRPSGPLITRDVLERIEVVELHRVDTRFEVGQR
jgi:eukaryotic-like serine/threonine-protein kinase